nr:MAG TPA: protein of unknown function (DUF4187) [Caudoviricetes sp.]
MPDHSCLQSTSNRTHKALVQSWCIWCGLVQEKGLT